MNYAEITDLVVDDDDFADFKPSPTSKTEKVKDKKEKVNGEEQKDDRERKHSKDRHRDHKKHKDKDRHREDKDRHRRDRDKHREDRDRHRKRDDKERDERKRRERKDREHKSERRDDNCSEDSSRGEGSSDSTYDSSGNQTSHNLPTMKASIPPSPLVSPSRRNPKPRLSLEEKIFQRELEVALEMSKEESSVPEPEEHKVTEGGTTLEERQETHPPFSPRSPQEQNAGDGGCSPPIGSTGAPAGASSLAPEEPSIPVCKEEDMAEQTPDPTPPPAVADCTETMEPMPSTSAGKTAKRIRKTVKFKEDSDSDDFDGFGCEMGAESDASEGSDFMPSPKKKKKTKESKKTKNAKPTRNSTQKSSSKSSGKNKAGDVAASPMSHPVIAKENTAPKDPATPPPTSTLASPKVTTSPELKASSALHTPPPAKIATKKASVAKPAKRPLISSSSSPSSGAPSISLVKTPFRSPLSTSPNSGYPVGSPATPLGAKTLNRGTGLRLGLSRRANVKPLHPSAASRITN